MIFRPQARAQIRLVSPQEKLLRFKHNCICFIFTSNFYLEFYQDKENFEVIQGLKP